jgi:Mg2+ and Co2+ transporter CorA
MMPVATSMVQLLESHRASDQAADMRKLTWIAVLFLPLSLVASLFSMSEEYSLHGEGRWTYVAAALPSVVVISLFMVPPRAVGILFGLTWRSLAGWRRRTLRRATGAESA